MRTGFWAFFGRGFSSARGKNVDSTAVLVKKHFAIGQREQGPIPSRADILTCNKFGTALAHQNAAGGDQLTTIFFDAQAFADAVAAVSDAALSFFVCHKKNRFNRYYRKNSAKA